MCNFSLLEFQYPDQLMKDIDMLSYPPYRSAIDFQCMFSDGETRCPFQLDVYCSRGRTPLMVAAFNQSLPILKYVIVFTYKLSRYDKVALQLLVYNLIIGEQGKDFN
uniref:ANK_REP_REGION domain-containing protein n=1 Tax=Angiostrongylus cantonensis TaxID=6313 RepID=A0A0K0CWW7_ANGCA